jgi:hypothetical protein
MKYCNEYLALFLLVVAVIIADPFMNAIREFGTAKDGFRADRVPSGEFPHEVDEPLLYPTYPKITTGYGVVLRDSNSTNNSKLYPVAANLANYDQATNNVREWVTPDNGSCSPAGMCGALYAPKTPAEYIVPSPIPLNDPARRVGFYGAERR